MQYVESENFLAANRQLVAWTLLRRNEFPRLAPPDAERRGISANRGGTGRPSATVARTATFRAATLAPHHGATRSPLMQSGAATAPQWPCDPRHRTTTRVPTVKLQAAQRDSVTAGAPAWSAGSKHEGAPRAATVEYAPPRHSDIERLTL